MARQVIIPYSPRDAFLPYHNSSARWRVIVAHRRAGKTVACVNEQIKTALKSARPDHRSAYIAPFYRQAKAVSWDYFRYYSRGIPGVRLNESELRIDYPNGSRIQLFGADNADALRGLFFDDVVADEFGDWKPSVFPSVIRPALADRQGKATIIGTPKGKNLFYDVFSRAKFDSSWFSLEVRASRSGILPASELADARRGMSEDQYEQEFECSFDAAILGSYYGKDLRLAEEAGRIRELEPDNYLPVHTAWDLGYSDDTAIWFYQVARDEIRVIDCYAASGESINHYVNVLKNRGYRYGRHWLPHDAKAKTLASGGRSIEEMLRDALGSVSIVPDLGVQDGIQAVRAMLNKTYIDRRCEGLESLKQYQREYDEDKKAFKERPRHDWTSHYADAFRMLAVAWRSERKEAPNATPKYWNDLTLNELWETVPKKHDRI